ncbi:MAG: ABC transporter permease [Gemmatimonadetes bacterium]|nr:ABC transporter permease [Gemmatimonadota bacterium]
MLAWFEGVGIALDSLRSNKTRAALTILGIAIGVMVVMVIASMITGINQGVTQIFEQAGPRTFYVFRFFQGGVVVSDGSDEMSPWRRNPPLTVEEAERLGELESVGFVVLDEGAGAPIDFGSRKLPSVSVRGVGVNWLRVSGGDVYPGRSFTVLEEQAKSRVIIPNQKLANELFGQRDPIGQVVKLAGIPYEVIGVYTPPPDLFGEGNQARAVVPHPAFDKYVPHWRGWINFLVSPAPGATVAEAIEDVTVTLRTMRGLRPGDDDTFSVVTGNRGAEGVGGPPAGDSVAIPGGGGDAHRRRRCRGDGSGGRHRRGRQQRHPHPRGGPALVHHRRPAGLGAHGRGVWAVPGGAGGEVGSGRGAAVRIIRSGTWRRWVPQGLWSARQRSFPQVAGRSLSVR